jgi:hypothetical protein
MFRILNQPVEKFKSLSFLRCGKPGEKYLFSFEGNRDYMICQFPQIRWRESMGMALG